MLIMLLLLLLKKVLELWPPCLTIRLRTAPCRSRPHGPRRRCSCLTHYWILLGANYARTICRKKATPTPIIKIYPQASLYEEKRQIKKRKRKEKLDREYWRAASKSTSLKGHGLKFYFILSTDLENYAQKSVQALFDQKTRLWLSGPLSN